jgi:hypothetical protein
MMADVRCQVPRGYPSLVFLLADHGSKSEIRNPKFAVEVPLHGVARLL